MTMKAPKFTVSMLCCNRLELTQACLNSIVLHSNPTNTEVIITDNGSSDGTKAWLKRQKELLKEWQLTINQSGQLRVQRPQ
jgi:GT2 family glycosyltransferase